MDIFQGKVLDDVDRCKIAGIRVLTKFKTYRLARLATFLGQLTFFRPYNHKANK